MHSKSVEIRIHPNAPLREDARIGHNRWHPDIEPVVSCRPGDTLIMETRDAVDGQIGPDSNSATVLTVDSSLVHPLTGPVFIEGARPGDLLELQIIDIVPSSFGYTMQQRGLGFLRDSLPRPVFGKMAPAGRLGHIRTDTTGANTRSSVHGDDRGCSK